MSTRELAVHVVNQWFLSDENQVLVDALEGFNLVVKLHQDCLRSHLPIHAELFGGVRFLGFDGYPLISQEALSLRPNSARRIERLKFDADEVRDLPAFG